MVCVILVPELAFLEPSLLAPNDSEWLLHLNAVSKRLALMLTGRVLNQIKSWTDNKTY